MKRRDKARGVPFLDIIIIADAKDKPKIIRLPSRFFSFIIGLVIVICILFFLMAFQIYRLNKELFHFKNMNDYYSRQLAHNEVVLNLNKGR